MTLKAVLPKSERSNNALVKALVRTGALREGGVYELDLQGWFTVRNVGRNCAMLSYGSLHIDWQTIVPRQCNTGELYQDRKRVLDVSALRFYQAGTCNVISRLVVDLRDPSVVRISTEDPIKLEP